ncbi:MAG: hypothetical protein AB7N80_09605 [Bdellovibrionales bacterium]
MSTAAVLEYNADRSIRVLKCRSHIKAFYYFTIGASSLWLLLGLASVAAFGLSENDNAVVWSLIFGFAVPALLLAFARFIVYPVAFTRVEIKPRSLIVRRSELQEHEFELPLKNIERVKLSYLPFIGGWMKIVMKDGTSYILSVALERSEYVLDAVMNFDAHLVDPDRAQDYRMTAIYYDHSWARLTSRLNNTKKIFVKYGLAAFIVPTAYFTLTAAQHAAKTPSVFKVLLVMVGTFVVLLSLGTVLWLLSETLVLAPASRRALKLDFTKPVRPIEFEKRVEIFADIVYILIVVGLVLALA